MASKAAPNFANLTIDRRPNNIYVITLGREKENKLTAPFCQEIIRAFHSIQREIKRGEGGAVITRGNNAKFWCTGLELDDPDPWMSCDGFYPLLATILDFPYPTVACITGHTFGGGCPLALAHDYRVMNTSRGFLCMPPVDLGLSFPGIGTLPRLKLRPTIARKMLLEAHRWTAEEALADDIVDATGQFEELLPISIRIAEKWAEKGKAGVYGVLRDELYGEASKALRNISYVHAKNISVGSAKL
ncbi:ClpP/crotonase [Thozetella sp. PMI_491]|nr:ClpP/crotonase [Thozetella sp. PMI_491]